jgi:hypothetical protein
MRFSGIICNSFVKRQMGRSAEVVERERSTNIVKLRAVSVCVPQPVSGESLTGRRLDRGWLPEIGCYRDECLPGPRSTARGESSRYRCPGLAGLAGVC